MAKKRGIIATLLHEQQQAAKRAEQQARAQARAQAQATRAAEQAQRAQQRAQAQQDRSAAAAAKAAEREAKLQHEADQLEEVERLNAELAATYEQIDTLLAATLDVDDHIDLEQLRQTAVHPEFSRPDLEQPTPRPAPLLPPPEPVYTPPDDLPKGLGAVFARKKKAAAETEAQTAHVNAHQVWQQAVAALPQQQSEQDAAYERAEQARLDALAEANAQWTRECEQREADTADANRQLDELIAGLQYGVEDAVQEYVAIVLANSVYPDCFPVDYDFTFDSTTKELTMQVTVPAPDDLPTEKEYKYVRARDEIVASTLTQKEQRDRYASAVAQVAVRTLHEVFEADRSARIGTVSLTIDVEALDVGTGHMARTPLIAVAADRDTFMSFDLSNAVPAATLERLNAVTSKNPWGLVPIDTTKGVRG